MPGVFVLSQETAIQADTPVNKAIQLFNTYCNSVWAYRKIIVPIDTSVKSNVLRFTSVGADALPPEGYHISITAQHIILTGKGAGLFYGVETLMQLMPADRAATAKIPCAEIDDYPRFAYRGMHLDVARHFFGVDFIKKYIDLMAMYKLNNFHWHLTDDQGWRIEIKKYPNLTLIGSKRAQTLIGNYHDSNPQQFDNTPYGGFYTQDEIRDVVKYAADRFINIIPEIEMPGHSEAAVAAYPELSCNPLKTYKVAESWGGFDDVFCPTEYTFIFLEDVLTEVMDLFPSKYIHIGGDEVDKSQWRASAFCRKLIKKKRLKDVNGLQSYFIQHIEKFVNSKGRAIIGWDEILQGGLAPNATVMSWTGEAGGIAAAQQHHNVIMTPGNQGLYFDKAQAKADLEPLGIGGYAPIRKTYAYNPVPVALNAEQQKYIMGVQANLWTEYIPTESKVEYMLLPRMLALAEIAWTPLANKNFADFYQTRLPQHLARLDAAGYNYRVAGPHGITDTITWGSHFNYTLSPSVSTGVIHYTIDGYTPRETDVEYTHPLSIDVPPNSSITLQAIEITPGGRRGVVRRAVLNNFAPLCGVADTPKIPGLKFKVHSGTFANTAAIDNGALTDTGITKNFGMAAYRKLSRNFGVCYTGYIRIDTAGRYSFSTASADGSVLLVDDTLAVDNDGKHSVFEQGGDMLLEKGFHKLSIKYFFVGAVSSLRVYITFPGRQKTELPPDIIFN